MSIPFRPTGATATASVTSTSTAAVALNAPVDAFAYTVRIVNPTANICFFRFGPSDVGAADATGFPVGGNQSAVITLDGAMTHFRAIALTGTNAVYLTAGIGG